MPPADVHRAEDDRAGDGEEQDEGRWWVWRWGQQPNKDDRKHRSRRRGRGIGAVPRGANEKKCERAGWKLTEEGIEVQRGATGDAAASATTTVVIIVARRCGGHARVEGCCLEIGWGERCG